MDRDVKISDCEHTARIHRSGYGPAQCLSCGEYVTRIDYREECACPTCDGSAAEIERKGVIIRFRCPNCETTFEREMR